MTPINLDAVRTKIRSLDYEPGTAEEVAEWRMANEDARHNLVVENMHPTPDEDALFALMMDEGVPLALQTQLALWVMGHPDARI